MEQMIARIMAAKEVIAWLALIGVMMLCLAYNSLNPTHDRDGRLGKTCAVLIVALMLIYGLAVL